MPTALETPPHPEHTPPAPDPDAPPRFTIVPYKFVGQVFAQIRDPNGNVVAEPVIPREDGNPARMIFVHEFPESLQAQLAMQWPNVQAQLEGPMPMPEPPPSAAEEPNQ